MISQKGKRQPRIPSRLARLSNLDSSAKARACAGGKCEERPDLEHIFDQIDLRVDEKNNTFDVESGLFHEGLPTFDPTDTEQFPIDASCILLGKRRTGKSHLAEYLLSVIGDRYSSAVIFTGTKFNNYWQRIIPEEYIHEGFDEQALARIIKLQEQRVDSCSANNKEQHEAHECGCDMIVLFDDVASEQHLHSSLLLGKLYTAGRHLRVTPYILTQYAYALSPAIRANTDTAFILHQTQRRSKEAIADEFMSQVDRKTAGKILSQTTPGYQVLVINNVPNSDDLRDVLSILQAPKDLDCPPLGCQEYYDAVRKQPEDLGTDMMMMDDHMKRKLQGGPRLEWPHCLKHTEDAAYLLDPEYA